MAPPSLQGLNVVHAPPAPPSVDAHDPLAAPFPDFSAHLDLWTNLAFESDEPVTHHNLKRNLPDDNDEETPPHDAHENVDHPSLAAAAPALTSPADGNVAQFDLNALLAGFGVEPLLASAPVQSTPTQIPAVPSLAQLLALHAAHGGTYTVPPPPPVVPAQPPTAQSAPKRARTTKAASTDSAEASPASTAPASPEASNHADTNTSPLSAAEDKRRRNTAASARFRLKKKEREAALERRAKELEERVVELERECEGLRRENGWLKGLVVGVTGAGAAQQQQAKAN